MPVGETVTVLTAGSRLDPYSQTNVEDWTDPTSRDVDLLWPAEPRPSSEPVQDARNAVVSGYTLYFPADDPINAYNRVIVRGQTYKVMGDPADWRWPADSSGAGIVVQTERMTG